MKLVLNTLRLRDVIIRLPTEFSSKESVLILISQGLGDVIVIMSILVT